MLIPASDSSYPQATQYLQRIENRNHVQLVCVLVRYSFDRHLDSALQARRVGLHALGRPQPLVLPVLTLSLATSR